MSPANTRNIVLVLSLVFVSIENCYSKKTPPNYATLLSETSKEHTKANDEAKTLLSEVVKRLQEVWEPRNVKKVQNVESTIRSSTRRLLQAYNIKLNPTTDCQQKSKRRRKRNQRKFSIRDTSKKSSFNISMNDVERTNDTIPLIRMLIIGPLVAATTLMANADLLQIPIVLIPILIVRTILGIIDGTLSYASSEGISDKVRNEVRDAYDEILANRGDSR